MLGHLPMRHRTLLAVGLGLVAVVVGAWVSTLVGEPTPEFWGLALGAAAGVVLAVGILE